MWTPLSDIEFLARSDHRVTVLETLTREGQTPNELQEETGISRATIGRVLGDFEERGWATRSGRTYVRTPFGDLLSEEFTSLLETVEMIQRIQMLAQWLPLDELNVDLRAFQDAVVTMPNRSDVLAYIRRSEAMLRDASQVRILTSSIFPDTLEGQVESVIAGEQTQEAILTSAALDAAFTDPEVTTWTREIIESDNATVYRYEGPIPFMLSVLDDTAVIAPLDDYGVPRALVESCNEEIRSWVNRTLDQYRDEAVRLTLEMVPS